MSIGLSSLAISGVALVLQMAQANRIDIDEAAARNLAYQEIEAAEEEFDCQIEEHSLKRIVTKTKTIYVFYLDTEGTACPSAVHRLVNSKKNEHIEFRESSQLPPPQNHEMDFGLPQDQSLIHEIDPGVSSPDGSGK